MATTYNVVLNEKLIFADDEPTVMRFVNILAQENYNMLDSKQLVDIVTVNENYGVKSSIIAGNLNTIVLNENYSYSNTALASKVISILIEDKFKYDNSTMTNAQYLALLSENYDVNAFINTYKKSASGELEVDDSLDCWVVNYDNNAFSRYSNYNFNSFAKVNGKCIGANSLGLYELDTEEGDETFISAKVKTGMIKISDGQKAVVQHAVIYHESDGNLKLKVLTENGEVLTGSLINPNNSTNSSTIQIGKGTRAVYWQFELNNDDVSNFSLNEIKLYVIKTSRNT